MNASFPKTLPDVQEHDRASFEAHAAEFDAAVLKTPAIDHFCSSSHWILPFLDAFEPERPALYLEGEHGWGAFAHSQTESGERYWSPLEAMWGLASPIVAEDGAAAARDFARVLSARDDWDMLWFSGLERGGPTFNGLFHSLATHFRMGLGSEAKRHSASLDGGWDGFLSRRTRKFRANLRRITRNADAAGVVIESVHANTPAEAEALLTRVMAIEARSWKGRSAAGVNEGGMRAFYDAMLPRLATAGLLRAVVGTRDGADVCYCFGALWNGIFRGLQMSFDNDHRALSLGNTVQGAMIRALSEEGAQIYDLGSDIAYKERWAEIGLTTVALVAIRR